MPPILPCFVFILAFFTVTEQSINSLKEIEQILKNLAAQASPQNRGKTFQYQSNDPRLQQQQKRRDRQENNRNFEDAQPPELFYQLDNMRIQKQLEEDLQQALRFESDRICKATGRCGCFGNRCHKPHRTVDRTVADMEELINELNKDLNSQHHKNLEVDEDRRQVYDESRERYGENLQERENQKQQYESKQREYNFKRQEYDNRKQKYEDRRQEYDDRRQRQDDRRQKQDNRIQSQYNNRYKQNDKRQEYDHGRQEYDDRRQRQGNSRQEQNDRRQEYDYIRREYDEGKQEYGEYQQYVDNRQQDNDKQQVYGYKRQDYDDRRQRQDDKIQKPYDRKQRQYDRRQEQDEKRQEYDDVKYNNIEQNLRLTSRNYKNGDFDIVVLEVPESNEIQNRANDVKVIDIREVAIKDLIQQQQTPYDKNEKKEQRVGNLNLEDFLKYYNKIKKEVTNGLLKYVKGLGDGSYLSQLLPYQEKQIQYLKNIQSKTALPDEDLKAKIVQLLFGNLSNIKIMPHSKDGQTIYIPQRVHDAIPSFNRNNILRSNKRLFPLTYRQKQRQRNVHPRNIIIKHGWRRNNQQVPNHGVPFDLQVQGLGQIN